MSEPRDRTRPAVDRELELDQALSLEVADRGVAEQEIAGLKEAWSLAGSVQLESGLSGPESADMRQRLLGAAGSAPRSGTGSAHSGAGSARSGTGSARSGAARSRSGTAPARSATSMRRVPRRLWLSLVAASLVLVALTGYLGTLPTVHTAPVGAVTIVELGDGTRIELSSGSRLSEPGWMNTGRSVVLTGEAFFDVAKAPETFRVAAGEAVITVLGTRFAVRSWPSEARTSVYLEEGSVSIESVTETSGAPLVMEPGQSVSASGSSVAINHDFSAEAALAWRTGDFVFVNAALGQVLDDVGRRFGVRIARGPGVDAGRMVNGAFRQPSDPGSVLGDLALSLGLNYRETSDGFEVFRP